MIRLFFALLSFALLSCGAKGTKETGNMPEIKKQPITSPQLFPISTQTALTPM